jgi:hypothetical protein
MRAARRKHYHGNKRPYLDRAVAQRAELKVWYRQIKDGQPCTDCDVPYPYYVLQFDHTGTDKVANINEMMRRCYGKARILAEIAKCDLVCANCHAARTWTRSKA